MEVEEVVQTEREMWERGRDVEAEVRILSGMMINYVNSSDGGSEIDLDASSSDSDSEGEVGEEDDGEKVEGTRSDSEE
jgi:hypothetical protein